MGYTVVLSGSVNMARLLPTLVFDGLMAFPDVVVIVTEVFFGGSQRKSRLGLALTGLGEQVRGAVAKLQVRALSVVVMV
jgi:hypothetical protein